MVFLVFLVGPNLFLVFPELFLVFLVFLVSGALAAGWGTEVWGESVLPGRQATLELHIANSCTLHIVAQCTLHTGAFCFYNFLFSFFGK